ncbi:MAG: hypothetical protein KF713_11225 [Turneriella sp.]|nr:hypothetical protein [Turneriella sp.]
MKYPAMMIKLRLLTLTILCASLVACKSGASKKSDEEYKKLIPIFDSILQTLDSWTASKAVKQDAVETTIRVSLKAIKDGRLGITINPDLPENFYEGANFAFSSTLQDPKPHISVSPYILSPFDQYPTITLSAFVHEMQHAHSYLQNPARLAGADGNPLEKYLYELDAYNVEARFILKYLANNVHYKITPFETLLARSFHENYLAEFSAKMLAHDMQLAAFLSSLPSKKISEEKMITELQKLLDSVNATEFNQHESESDTFFKLMPYYTVNQFLPVTIRDIYYKTRSPQSEPQFDFARTYPKLASSYQHIAEVLQAHRDMYFSFAERSRQYYKRL